ncbi:MAG TPA: methyltransferase domain-containing protein [Planctomycetota bacterium]|nr:methyltransferase domain-containing protein [Planctomycetota bacterium]
MVSNLIRRTYDSRAPLYNAIVRVLSFGGDSEYRRAAVQALDLKPGDRVLDIGCGTGLNFRDIAKAVGPTGLVVGTDLSHGMLSEVEGRPNLRLVQAAASQSVFKPATFDAILSTYVISTILDEEILGPLCRALKPGGKLVIADDTMPPGWFIGPRFMFGRMFKKGWPDLKGDTIRALRPLFTDLRVTHRHFGMIYIISGRRK